ncbi:hypothetical protein SAMN05216285_1779 [Natrinema salifodinae]|uniref:Uncharacterized protein n=1 Tax=Natrinema salifodinae TaxID=1202768 RepID=A0A1I0NJ31_9EURY|nr:hypothetical protein SAMN05216285_1779 [Natrinema salifodinae]
MTYFCPVEGCDKHADEWSDEQPPFASREAVRSHINAKSGDDHQRARDQGAWKAAPTSSEGADGGEVESSDEQQPKATESSNDQQTEQTESGDEGGDSSPSSNDTTTRAATSRILIASTQVQAER